VGVPKTWDESKKDLGYIRKAGVRQFISTYNRVKDLKGDELLWGDEIEYGVFHIDPHSKKVRLSLRAKEVSDKGMCDRWDGPFVDESINQSSNDCFDAIDCLDYLVVI
jgi:hypothetical protein